MSQAVGTLHAAGTFHSEGTVDSFDKDVGLGEVRGQDGRVHQFHCTEIADGSRNIAVGTQVSFALAPGHLGSWEARRLEPSV